MCEWWLDPVGSGGVLLPGSVRWPRAKGAEGRIRHISTELWLQSCLQLPTGTAVLWDTHRAQGSPGKGLKVFSPALKSCLIPGVGTCHRQNGAEPLGWAWAA